MEPTEELRNEHRIIEKMLKLVSTGSERLERDQEVDSKLFSDAADFFKNFADKCHHSKEEKLLFEKMIERGIPKTTGPIAVMLAEHEQGRTHVREMGSLSDKDLSGMTKARMILHVRGYVDLLSQHIQKEDNILYPMAEQVLTEDDEKALVKGFEDVEERIMGPGVHEKYHKMIESWEKKLGTESGHKH